MENAAIVSDPGSSHYLPGHSKPYDPRAAADAQESMKAKLVAIRKKLLETVRAKHCTIIEKWNPLCAVTKSFLGGRTGAPQGGAHAPFKEMMEREKRMGMLVITSFTCSLMSAHVCADNKAVWIIISVQGSVNPSLTCLLSPLQGPCHVELQRALDKIAKSQQKLGDKLTRFYLPNCDKRGLYKPKQVSVFKLCVSVCLCTKETQVVSESQDYSNHSFRMIVCVC